MLEHGRWRRAGGADPDGLPAVGLAAATGSRMVALSAVVAASVLVLAAPQAASAPTWRTVTLTSGKQLLVHDVALAPDGTSTVLAERARGAVDLGDGQSALELWTGRHSRRLTRFGPVGRLHDAQVVSRERRRLTAAWIDGSGLYVLDRGRVGRVGPRDSEVAGVSLDVAGDGTLAVAIVARDAGGVGQVFVAIGRAEGRLGRFAALGMTAAPRADIVALAGGRARVAWFERAPTAQVEVPIRAATATAGGLATSRLAVQTVDVGRASSLSAGPYLIPDAGDGALVLWAGPDGFGATRLYGDVVGSRRQLAPAITDGRADAARSGGTPWAAWYEGSGPVLTLHVRNLTTNRESVWPDLGPYYGASPDVMPDGQGGVYVSPSPFSSDGWVHARRDGAARLVRFPRGMGAPDAGDARRGHVLFASAVSSGRGEKIVLAQR